MRPLSCRLLFIRHGQSLGNQNGVFLGHTDLDLSSLGYSQAEAVGEYLKTQGIDAIFSSDLIRAHNTALPLSEALNIKITDNKNFREIFAGDWENKRFDYLIENYPVTYTVWRNDIGNAVPDSGEAVSELYERIVREAKKIALENDGRTVAIFTHATPIRALFTYIYGKSAEGMCELQWAPNASVSEAVYENGCFNPIGYGFNEHLGDMKTVLPPSV